MPRARLLLVAAVLAIQACSSSLKDATDRAGRAGRLQTTARVTLVADRTDGARTYRFVAEIVGGPDDDQALYCVTTTWDFGDGPALGVTPSCAPWTPGTRIQRRFETSHAYERSQRYTVEFSHGPLAARRVVDVP
jgi:hypothetical protein